MPSGCPRETAPPLTFTLEWSSSNNFMLATTTALNASFISNRSTLSLVSPALSIVFFIASAGAIPKCVGSVSESANDKIFARGLYPKCLAFSALITTNAQAPSLIDEAFAAVIDPFLSKTGFNDGIFSNFTFLNSSSSSTNTTPFLPSTSTGVTSVLKNPLAQASAALLYESMQNLSCSSLVSPYFRIVFSVQAPINTLLKGQLRPS
mmetsp:Transcript_226/g.216  ORF Transcript_226/g.216 Transcript_226/m.216 type:complete len:207 (-) Transcript_226:457-1077(-)